MSYGCQNICELLCNICAVEQSYCTLCVLVFDVGLQSFIHSFIVVAEQQVPLSDIVFS